jgi:hypothetical protein
MAFVVGAAEVAAAVIAAVVADLPADAVAAVVTAVEATIMAEVADSAYAVTMAVNALLAAAGICDGYFTICCCGGCYEGF